MLRKLLFAVLLPAALVAQTGVVEQVFEFSPADFVFDRVSGFDVVALPGQYWTSEPGRPLLPLAAYNVLIPPDAEVTGVEVTNLSTTVLPGEFNIHPAQRPQVLSKPLAAFVGPDDKTYRSDLTYPTDVVNFTRSGSLAGFRVAGVRLVPLRYVPGQRRLELTTRVVVSVKYRHGQHEVPALDESQVEFAADRVARLVRNPEQTAAWRPVVVETDDWRCDMVVITTNALAASFQPFVDWKTRRGIKTVVVKTESIYAACQGRDNQEKIRNCVIDYWQNHGLKWLLVGGDAEVVPVRTCRITCEGNVEDIASDMYYADLQYSWDSDHNNLFGEMTDSVDLFHDIIVGRTPCDNASDVATFFAKDTMFERHQDTLRLKQVLFGSTMLFDPFHGKVINRMMAEQFPVGWQFNHLEDPGSGVYRNAMSQGYQLAHVAAHGNPTTFSVMSSSEVPSLTNGYTKLNFVNSIACQSGWFDGQECLAEALVKATNGGCVACALNSRYGFGYPPGFGPSEMLDLEFYRHLISGAGFQFGTLNTMSKDYFQSLVMGQEVWRWCAYELNLFGDPSLGVWSEKPLTLTVTKPDSVLVGPQTVRITVKQGTAPMKGALVCLSKGSETYARGWTNSAGWVDLLVSPASTGSLTLSASARNCYPHDGLIPVRGSGAKPALVFGGLRIDDGGNGRLDPGESADLYVSVANPGAQAATSVNAKLRTSCSYLTLLDSTASYGTIAVNDTVEADRFRVTASSATPAGTLVELVTACTASEGYWEPYCETRIGPQPPARKLWADHDTGNMILSVTSVGSVGTLGPYREGSGLKFPRDAGYGSLYFTSLACGNGPSYVVDRWYGQPTSTFQTDWATDDTLYGLVPPMAADEEFRARISDANHATPKGLVVNQWSGALASPAYRDFVIVEYLLENQGANALNDLYCGILSDFDVNNTTSNTVTSDQARRLTYMKQSSSADPCVGVKLLSPTVAANQSAIDHAVYVQPTGMMTEAVKDSLLRGSIRLLNSNRTANWSCVVSAGPFNLAPGARQKVAFAFVGGESETEIRTNADSAQSWYDKQMPTGVSYLKHTVDDQAGGNGDGIINPGESINLPLWVANRTDAPARGVWGTLRKTSGDTLVTVTDSVRYFGTVGAGDSAGTGTNGFKFRVAPACTNRYQLPLVLVCTDTLDSSYVSSLPLVCGAPQLVQSGVQCWDPQPGGNNNGKLDPGEQAELALGLRNIGLGNAENVWARLRSGDARLTVLDSSGGYGLVRADSLVFNSSDRFTVQANASIPRETQVPCTLLVFGDRYQATRVVMVAVGALTNTDPIPDGPRSPARYYAYDDCDTFYVAAPEFNWVEVRSQGTRLNFSNNDAVVVVNLPSGFGPFYYYGQRYTQVSVSADGWLVPGNYTTTNYSNTALPSTSAPPAAICANWDDLYPGYGSAGYAYWWHDAANHRFVIEFDSSSYYSPSSMKDKFEFLLYDSTLAAMTGDNEVVVQYLTANNYVSNTVGLQDQSRAVGIQCLYNGAYHRAAAQVVAGRATRYTTDSIQTGVREQESGATAGRLDLAAGPNPVSGQSHLRLSLPKAGHVRLAVHDITGRMVRTLVDAELPAGRHAIAWDRKDDRGRTVSGGVYLYRLETASGELCRKAVVLR